MKLSGSYFKKMDDLTKWIFGRNKDNTDNLPKKSVREPQTLNEAKLGSYASFQADNKSNDANSSKTSILRQVKSARDHHTTNTVSSERYMKKISKEKTQGCTICLDAAANAVLMDCGHGAICFECGLALLDTTCECHLCREPVIQVLKIDISFINDDLLKVIEAADLYSLQEYNKKRISLHTTNL